MHCGLTYRTKKHLTYMTIGLFNLFTGIEFAVILPTVWIYLDNHFHAPQFFLGFVISAFCLADLLAAPVIGRLSDYTHDTKTILIISNIVQTAGNLMYFFGLSAWFLVGGRFIAGIGSSVSATLIADVVRVTTEGERTSTLYVLAAMRQFGYIIGPGCNIFLSHLDFSIGPFSVNKYSAPGLLMAVVWMLHEILCIFCFWNMPALHLQEQLERAEAYERTQPSIMSESQPTGFSVDADEIAAIEPNYVSTYGAVVSSLTCTIVDLPISVAVSPRNRVQRRSSHRIASTRSSLSSTNDMIEEAEQFMSEDLTSVDDDPLSERSHRQSWTRDASSPISQYSKPRNGSCEHASNKRPSVACDGASGARTLSGDNGSTDQIMEPRLHLRAYSWQYYIDVMIYKHTGCNIYELIWAIVIFVVMAMLVLIMAAVYVFNDTCYGLMSLLFIPEFFRDEVFAMMLTAFVSFFNQLVFETMLTPITRKFLNWGDFENSLVFCVAGFEVVIILFLLTLIGRRVSDFYVIILGLFIQAATIIFFLWFIPNSRPGDYRLNMPVLLTAIFIGLLGLPLVAVAGMSLLSKITRLETQGLAQGINRVFRNVGLIFGSLWAGSMLEWPYWMFGTMLAMTVLMTIPVLLSHKLLRVTSLPPVHSQHQYDIPADETTPLLL